MSPSDATVLHALLESVAATPDALAVRVVEKLDDVVELSYRDLYRAARRGAAGYAALGLAAGDRVVLAIPTGVELLAAYLGALFTGAIPLVTHAPRKGADDAEVERLGAVARSIGARAVVAPGALAGWPEAGGPRLVSPSALLAHGEAAELPPPAAGSIAHLQLTSGSTGGQRAVVVRHAHVAANVAAIERAIRLRPDDHLMIWLPLYHDMGLIAFSCTLGWQRPMTLTDTSNFIRNPIRYWWQVMARYRATITAAPNSAYQTSVRLAAKRLVPDLDLSAVRLAFWGAEPIHAATIRAFADVFARHGYRPEATLPVYGLAEATLAVTIPDVEEPPHVDDRRPHGRLAAHLEEVSSAVSVGRPLAGHDVRLRGGDGELVGDGEVGELEVAGPSLTAGYWTEGGEPAPLPAAGGYLATGDLGYRRGDRLFVIGRRKELIIVGGRNFVPDDIEQLAERVVDSGAIKGIAAVGIVDEETRTEAVHVIVEHRASPAETAPIEERLRQVLMSSLGLAGITVHWVARGTIPKTTSGKIQRFRCRELARELLRSGPSRAARWSPEEESP